MARIAGSSRGCESWGWAMCWPSNRRTRGGIPCLAQSARFRRPHGRPGGRALNNQAGGFKVTRTFRDGSSQEWWALEVITGPYGPSKQERVVIATTDPLTLPELTTCYLVTNLPAPGSQQAADSELAAASLEEVVRLYGLRMWVEQSYKQVKHALGWSQYQVRSDKAIRRHWQLVCCAFSFYWYHASSPCFTTTQAAQAPSVPEAPSQRFLLHAAGTGEKNQRGKRRRPQCLGRWRCGRYADGWSPGSCSALLERLVSTAPTSCVATPARLA